MNVNPKIFNDKKNEKQPTLMTLILLCFEHHCSYIFLMIRLIHLYNNYHRIVVSLALRLLYNVFKF